MAGGTRRLTLDLFCTVVDNYGDIGVCWRLARQLASEHAIVVRLWLDDLTSLQHIEPTMRSPGIEIRAWEKNFPAVEPADIVIEAFACDLPDNYIAAMAARPVKPVWINLEYLSAEGWVDDFHLGQSRHPVWPLTKYFYFPGFTPTTGGLIREAGLGRGFDPAAIWAEIGLPPPSADELRISIFGYDNPALESLLGGFAKSPHPVTCLIPQGALAARAGRSFGAGRGHLHIHEFPFLQQDDYDRLLWACDCNFVRGEDSFVRAQWAGKPFVWHIYPQQGDAHRPKLDAFIDRYCATLPAAVAADLRDFWHGWNCGAAVDWPGFWRNRAILQAHADAWKAALADRQDLASGLVSFCKSKV